MGFTRALYYPSIDIGDEEWLKTAILFRDEISTIVPSSLVAPYSNPTSRYLADEGIITPFHVNPNMDMIDKFD